jgi:hypothetical protein
MAYVPGFDHDIFVSYAHADDVLDASGHRWVTSLVERLREALRQRLSGTTELRWFFDTHALHSNHQIEEVLTAARRSACFLAVASRSYAERPWTQRELAAFVDSAGDTRRLFAVECLPIDISESYPEPLDSQKRLTFWKTPGSDSITPMPLSPTLDAALFHQRVHDLAEQMRTQLRALRAQAGILDLPRTTTAAPIAVKRPAKLRTVLLAQVTDDLEPARDELRRYLEQFGIPVRPSDDYPGGGEPFRSAFAEDLSQSQLFVQLLGPYPGRAPRDLPEGYTIHQHEAALAQRVEILQWRRPDIDPAAAVDQRYRTLLQGETVIADSFEVFKAEVRARAEHVSEAAPARDAATRSSLVFINADSEDLAIARELKAEFQRHRIPVSLPVPGDFGEATRLDLEENLVECSALILVYGQATPVWVRGQLRLFNKLRGRRSEPPRVLAVYAGPPAPKSEIDFSLPDVVEIDSSGGVQLEPIRAMVKTLLEA